MTGGNGSWRAELSLTGFGEDASSRWWMTGVEWLWKARSDEAGKGGKRFKGVERQEILELVNREILPPEGAADVEKPGADDEEDKPKAVDAPLVRLVNFIRKLPILRLVERLNFRTPLLDLSTGGTVPAGHGAEQREMA